MVGKSINETGQKILLKTTDKDIGKTVDDKMYIEENENNIYGELKTFYKKTFNENK
jgi:hypothetical protein